MGDELHVILPVTITNVGEALNTPICRVSNASGADVTENYNILCMDGKLTVLPRTLVIETASQTKEYDGTPLQNHTYYFLSESDLLEGHRVESVMFPEQSYIVNVGVLSNEIASVKIVDESGNDVSYNYELQPRLGELSITPRPITVRSGSAAKDYDGTPLTCDEFSIVSITQPISGHTVEVALSGERTEVGESENVFAEVQILDARPYDYMHMRSLLIAVKCC